VHNINRVTMMNYILKNLTINKKLILLYMLNVFDVSFSLFLINLKSFSEANPLMSCLFKNPIYAFLFKTVVPGLLLLLVHALLKPNPKKQFTFCVAILNFAIILYVLVNILHLVLISYIGYLKIL
jgi:hypothetical protein